MKFTFAIAALTLVVASASAQVVLTGPGTYYQNFDNLAPNGLGNAWVDNNPAPTMQGWYSNQTSYDADNGTLSASGQYSEGQMPSPERALGSVALPGALIVYGMRINNASGGTFGALTLNYTGEQWRDGGFALTDVLSFSYSTNATSLFSGNWTSFNPLDFNSVSNVGAGPLNGNLAVNQANPNGTITGLNWLNGTDVWVRWLHVGNASRHALALDDMHVNATPVPEPMTLIAGAIGLAIFARPRRRRVQ
jgi:uncharacterized protein